MAESRHEIAFGRMLFNYALANWLLLFPSDADMYVLTVGTADNQVLKPTTIHGPADLTSPLPPPRRIDRVNDNTRCAEVLNSTN